jgi:ribosomal protein L21E
MKTPKMNKAGKAKMATVMKEFGKGELHSGKGGKVVKDQKQALAIAISSAAKKMGRMK